MFRAETRGAGHVAGAVAQGCTGCCPGLSCPSAASSRPCSCVCGFPSTGTQRPAASLLCGLPGPRAAMFAHVLPTPGLMSIPTCTYFLWAFPAGRVLLCPACHISLVLRCALSLPLSVHEMGCILPWVGDVAPLVALVSPHKRTAICDDGPPPDALPPTLGPSAPSETTPALFPGCGHSGVQRHGRPSRCGPFRAAGAVGADLADAGAGETTRPLAAPLCVRWPPGAEQKGAGRGSVHPGHRGGVARVYRTEQLRHPSLLLPTVTHPQPSPSNR